jgi:hypothetical protein
MCVEENVREWVSDYAALIRPTGELDGLIKLHILGNFDITRVCGFLAFAATEVA